jgi:hypothetical protein
VTSTLGGAFVILKGRQQILQPEVPVLEPTIAAKTEEIPIEKPRAIVIEEPQAIVETGVQALPMEPLDPTAKWIVNRRVTIRFSNPYWYEARGILRTLHSDGKATLDIPDESGQITRIVFPGNCIDEISRMNEAEWIRTLYSKANQKLQGHTVSRIARNEDGTFRGDQRCYHKDPFNLTGFTWGDTLTVDGILAEWERLGDKEVLGVGYTWTEEWAKQAEVERKTKYNIFQRADKNFIKNLSDEQAQSIAEAAAVGLQIAIAISEFVEDHDAGPVPSGGKMTQGKPPRKHAPNAQSTPEKDEFSNTISGTLVHYNGRPFTDKVEVKIVYLSAGMMLMSGRTYSRTDGTFKLSIAPGKWSKIEVAGRKMWEGKSGSEPNLKIRMD